MTISLSSPQSSIWYFTPSVFGKRGPNVVDWINKGKATYINKGKALTFLSHQSAPIAAAAAKAELISAAKVVENFENPKLFDKKITNIKPSEQFLSVRRSRAGCISHLLSPAASSHENARNTIPAGDGYGYGDMCGCHPSPYAHA